MRKILSSMLKVLLVTLLIVSAILQPRKEGSIDNFQVLGQESQSLPVEQKKFPVLRNQAQALQTTAHSALALDLKTKKILYEKAGVTRWPTASLSKLMVALVVVNTVSAYAVVEVKAEDTNVIAPRMGLVEGEKITVADLLKGMLISSSNDATLSLARNVGGSKEGFVRLMNIMAQQLNLNGTHFQNPVGFDDPEQYTTARDVVALGLEFLKHQDLAGIVQIQTETVTSQNGLIQHQLKSSNRLLSHKGVMGIKTGYTDEARGNLVLLSSGLTENQILTVVLGSENREDDSLALVNWVFSSFEFK